MGATLFTMKATGKDVNEVFNELVSEATFHYGHDPYNGTISTTSLGHEIKLTKEVEKLMKDVDSDEHFDKFFPMKRDSQYVKQINHYKGYVPKFASDKENVVRKKGVRNEQKFTALPKSKKNQYYPQTFTSITEAKREAKKLALQKGEDIVISQLRSNGERFQLGLMKLETDGKEHKSKRSAKNKVYLPEYEFTFFVYAGS